MVLNKLGVKGKGCSYFYLEAEKPTGYIVTAVSKEGKTDVFNNCSFIEWLSDGVNVFIVSEHHKATTKRDFKTYYDSVTIHKAFTFADAF